MTVPAANGLLRRTLTSLPAFPTQDVLAVDDAAQLWRAYTVLSFIAHVSFIGTFDRQSNVMHCQVQQIFRHFFWCLRWLRVQAHLFINDVRCSSLA